MTAYFDKAQHELRDITPKQWWTEAPHLELRVVHDCTVAVMLPGMPIHLRMAIHRAVLDHGVTTQPESAPEVDFETNGEHRRRLGSLIFDLHTAFHAIARHKGTGWDDPRTHLMAFAADGDEERDRMARGVQATQEQEGRPTAPDDPQTRIASALEYLHRFGGIDGAHHKTWTLDQVVRALTGCPLETHHATAHDGTPYTYETQGTSDEYTAWVTAQRAGEDGPNTYEWDEGCPP